MRNDKFHEFQFQEIISVTNGEDLHVRTNLDGFAIPSPGLTKYKINKISSFFLSPKFISCLIVFQMSKLDSEI